jgi:nitroimidazol reductase NimA-like FMN-containing flavoprotein (pyridoxamine 5'-phosphate oxidase superfamily)
MTSKTAPPAGGQGGLEYPLGQARGGELRVLGPEECLALLESGSVGRVGLMSADGIVMLPVNYAVLAKTVVFRTAPDTLLAAHTDDQVSFEADHIDETSREGWSVLLQGHARKVTGEDEVRRLEHRTGLEPWACGARDVWVRIVPVRISGRRIRRP